MKTIVLIGLTLVYASNAFALGAGPAVSNPKMLHLLSTAMNEKELMKGLPPGSSRLKDAPVVDDILYPFPTHDVPEQCDGTSCGPNSAARLMRFYNINITYEKLRKKCRQTFITGGTTPDAMVDCMNENGGGARFTVARACGFPKTAITKVLADGNPFLALINPEHKKIATVPELHWVVVNGYKDGYVRYFNTDDKQMKRRIDKFISEWDIEHPLFQVAPSVGCHQMIFLDPHHPSYDLWKREAATAERSTFTLLNCKYHGHEYCYAFHKDKYFRYTPSGAIAGPRQISSGWPKVFPKSESADPHSLRYSENIEAAMLWPDKLDKVFFFRGDEYTRFDLTLNRAEDGYPKKIADHWPGLWKDHIDAGFVVPESWNERLGFSSSKAYFFKDNEYIRYDISQDRADPKYPKKIPKFWSGLSGRIRGITVDEEDGIVSFIKENEYVAYDLFEDKVIQRTDIDPMDYDAFNPFQLQLDAKRQRQNEIK
jgi:hypothetical protein